MEAKIKPEDLRIGNYVKRNGIVVQIDHQTFWDIQKYPGQYKPIELTEEWLLKFSFEIIEIYAGLSEAYYGHNPVTQDYLFGLKNTGNGWFYRNGFFKIKYVHQLQNLVYAISGSELTINEQK